MDKIMTLQNIVHPLHTNLSDGPNGPMHIIGQLINDPWYTNHALRLRSSSHHDSHGEPTAPDFDVCESDNYYFLEGELAGIASKDDLKIEWIGRRTLLIEATVNKVDEEVEWGVHLQSHPRAVDIEGTEAGNSGERESHSKHQSEKRIHGKALRVWMNERRTGDLRKSFTFPCDVNADHMRARLTNGLVKILVPKLKAEEAEPPRRVHIEE